MERYTVRAGGAVSVPPEQLEAALERLARFEDMALGLEAEQGDIAARLAALRGRAGTRPFSSGSCWPRSSPTPICSCCWSGGSSGNRKMESGKPGSTFFFGEPVVQYQQ